MGEPGFIGGIRRGNEMREAIQNLRCIRDSDCLRLTFQWPPEVDHVRIFKTESDDFDMDNANPTDGKLLTLHEYKRRGGYVVPREPGIFTFYIGDGKITCQTGRTTITGTIKRRFSFGAYTTHVLTLSADHPVREGVLCYTKRPKTANRSEGMVYSFRETLNERPLVRHILTMRHECLEISVADETKKDLYDLRIKKTGG
jgi:hypothetical protein